MAKSPAASSLTTAGPGRRKAEANGHHAGDDSPPLSRIDRLVALSDHCTAAITLADGLQERVLAYLLAMAIEEARAAMRQDGAGLGR